MDRIIYTAMNGAARIAEHQTVLGNNMANVNTPGFREQIALYRSVPMADGTSLPTRVSTVASTPGNNFEMGNMMTTGRELDVALAGPGWFALQTPQGEAYTRAGALQVGVNGLLQTATGQPVLSDQNAVIEVPDQASLTIASDGTVTAIGAGDPPNNILNLGRLKMVNPPPQQLVHGDDGVFRMPQQPNGQPAAPLPADPSQRLLSGVLEGSNASPMGAMVGMIQNARRFEMQMQVIREADKNAERANGILAAAS
ncbi:MULTISPECIES: flagellar basal body rod protein FlgF [Bordetella]|uniref:Flagellar basal-body rod protein FlgF n=1 Tax=Bordetella genomosp. 6 TaxID=463024 RepID=A0ABX4FKY5_9BORD|nr:MULTISPECIES: flagellar basal body rod protein FlgF [Bordetella]AOB27058.1 flagellar biosynthesis protein FlgF [Bordetella bronchiseptica]ARP76746.1 flagellar biosynthesis protein FlgF [Bordetella genomosp. 6]AZW44370.1 flagellar basal body rod protein FlgF [Bordetella bronchiseptica]KCV66805.1 flagella basal body rod protein [Bordetella bronchiseptica 99-R-0433]MBN3269776.1 flagellar basal body rod protein FlgF [Bordetella bronchiseptica]